jgi:hypothetical protein
MNRKPTASEVALANRILNRLMAIMNGNKKPLTEYQDMTKTELCDIMAEEIMRFDDLQ